MTFQAQSCSSASVSQLWDVVSDVTRWPDYLQTFVEVSEVDGAGPGDIGRRFRVRQPGLPSTVYAVTAWVAGSGFTWVARAPGVTTTATHAVAMRDDGSQLTLTVDWRGPLAPVVRLLLGAKTQRLIEIEASTLARVAQQGE